MLINYLFQHRVRVSPFTLAGLKYLAKRVLLLSRLIQANRRQGRLRRQGATIGALVMINDAQFEEIGRASCRERVS